ncbi:MAG: hypothetical protein GY750_08040 [Lentisphaerae bacterium]|nr:hypothetical protein [Lentisphaerota bacterium]MCP4101358.1 hypothetical protein [Lentisphaerota bacterium]
MNWNTYSSIIEGLNSKNLLQAEFLRSQCLYNNAFRMYDSDDKMSVTSNYYNVFEKQYSNSKVKSSFTLKSWHLSGDFVWEKSNNVITTHEKLGGIGGSGHPGLSKGGMTDCAGRIIPKDSSVDERFEGPTFFFHSGHFNPKVRHAAVFYNEFIKSSCKKAQHTPDIDDSALDYLCNEMILAFYTENSRDVIKEGTFMQICRTFLANKSNKIYTYTRLSAKSGIDTYRSKHSKPITIHGSSKESIRSSQHSSTGLYDSKMSHNSQLYIPRSKPISIGNPSRHRQSSYSSHSYSRYQKPQLQQQRPISIVKPLPVRMWVPDSVSKKCQLCRTEFGFFTRKHHCRFCGKLICSSCYTEEVFNNTKALQSNGTLADVTSPQKLCSECKQNSVLD